MRKRVSWLSVLAFVLASASAARADDACRAVEIKPLQGDDRVIVRGLNNLGQVTGWSTRDGGTTTTGLIWSYGRVRVLEPLAEGQFTLPEAINDLGQVVGLAGTGSSLLPVIWTRQGVEPLPGTSSDQPQAINDRGQVAGSRGASCLFWRDRYSEPIAFGQVDEGSCMVEAINDRGVVVGFLTDAASGEWHAFVWRDGTLTPVGPVPLPGEADQDGLLLYDINNWGWAVGVAAPYGDMLLHGVDAGPRLLLGHRQRRAVAINAWGTIFAVDAASDELWLLNSAGAARPQGALRGGVNGQELFANDRYQLAWWGADNRGYFCQLPW